MASLDSDRCGSPRSRRRLGRFAPAVLVVAAAVAACSVGSEAVDDTSGSSPDSTAASTPETEDSAPGSTTESTEPPADSADDPDASGRSGDDSTPGEDFVPYRSPAQAPDEVQALLADLDGKLAIGDDHSVAVSRPDGRAYIELEGDPSRLISQPTWSRDGTQLIWSSASPVSQDARLQEFDEDGVVEGDPVRIAVPGPAVFYFQWSADDAWVFYLRNSARRSTLEAGVVTPDRQAAWMSGGNPFFVSWAPNRAVIAGHVGDEQISLFDPAGSLPLIAPPDDSDDDEDPDPVPPGGPVEGRALAAGGGFSAPAWLDDDTLLAVVSGWLSAVPVTDGPGSPTVERLLELDGPVRFVLSPDRTKVALQGIAAGGSDQPMEAALDSSDGASVRPVQSGDPLVVFDLETRDSVLVTEEPVVAWEWSPDSSKLAWLGIDGPLARRQARWRFWSAEGVVPGDASAPAITLSDKELVNYLPFFAQYSQSITRWSPDSSAFALAGTIDGARGIWVHLVDQAIPAVLVAPGDFVTWGPGPTPPPTAGRSPA